MGLGPEKKSTSTRPDPARASARLLRDRARHLGLRPAGARRRHTRGCAIPAPPDVAAGNAALAAGERAARRLARLLRSRLPRRLLCRSLFRRERTGRRLRRFPLAKPRARHSRCRRPPRRSPGSAPKLSLNERCQKSRQWLRGRARKPSSTVCAQLMHNLVNGRGGQYFFRVRLHERRALGLAR